MNWCTTSLVNPASVAYTLRKCLIWKFYMYYSFLFDQVLLSRILGELNGWIELSMTPSIMKRWGCSYDIYQQRLTGSVVEAAAILFFTWHHTCQMRQMLNHHNKLRYSVFSSIYGYLKLAHNLLQWPQLVITTRLNKIRPSFLILTPKTNSRDPSLHSLHQYPVRGLALSSTFPPITFEDTVVTLAWGCW